MIDALKRFAGSFRPFGACLPPCMRRQLAAVPIVLAALWIQQAAVFPAVAATAPTPAQPCKTVRSGLAPLPYAQSIVANAREAYQILSEAMTAVHDRDKVVLRLALKDVHQRLDEIGAPPSARMVRAQIRIVQHDLKLGPDASDAAEWDTLAADIEQYLSGTINVDHDWVNSQFQAARAAMLDGRRGEAAADLEKLLATIGRRFDAFPVGLAYEDVSSALKAAQEPDPIWLGVQTGVRQAMAQLNWTVRGNPLPLLHAYYATSDAVDSCPGNNEGARRLLREAASALSKGSPGLAAEAERLSAEPQPAKAEMVNLQGAIRDTIAQAQKRAGDNYIQLPSATVGNEPTIEMKGDRRKAPH
jgi:hypothetical protein